MVESHGRLLGGDWPAVYREYRLVSSLGATAFGGSILACPNGTTNGTFSDPHFETLRAGP